MCYYKIKEYIYIEYIYIEYIEYICYYEIFISSV